MRLSWWTKEVAVPVEVVREVPGQKYVTDPSTGKAVSAPAVWRDIDHPHYSRA